MWVTDGSVELKIGSDDATIITCHSTKKGDSNFNAMWTDEVNSGEHYWVITFSDLEGYAAIGLTNKARFKAGYGLKAMMFGGNLHNGSALLVQNFGPAIKPNDTIGLLVSFTTSRPPNMQIYFFQNGKSLGLAFDVPSPILPNACPVINFSHKGSAKIRKEATIPKNRIRSLQQYSGVEGPWKGLENFVQIDGKHVVASNGLEPYGVTMKISSVKDSKNKYSVHLTVINHINFTIDKTSTTWKSPGGATSTLMGGSEEMMTFESKMSDLCQNPDTVTLDRGTLKLVKGSGTKVSFVRFDDTPGHFRGDPFA